MVNFSASLPPLSPLDNSNPSPQPLRPPATPYPLHPTTSVTLSPSPPPLAIENNTPCPQPSVPNSPQELVLERAKGKSSWSLNQRQEGAIE